MQEVIYMGGYQNRIIAMPHGLKIKKKVDEYQEQKWIDITKEETVLTIMKSSNWKALGNNEIANFWVKNLTSIHDELSTAYNDILKRPEKAPDWLTDGLTNLLCKTEKTKNPKGYRPIICLLGNNV